MSRAQDDTLEFTQETMRDFAKEVREIRLYHLIGVSDAGACPFAEQHYLLALNALEQAAHNLEMAALSQTRALATDPRR